LTIIQNMTTKNIKNEDWTVDTLKHKVTQGEIYKPKYQRKRKWEILPKKNDKHPSEKKYIEFLFETHNTVHAITFGQDGNKLSNIDGNNRINAIMHFLNEPFVLFPEKIEKIKNSIENEIKSENSSEIVDEIITIIKKMTYNDLMIFKYSKYFTEQGYDKLYKDHLKSIRDEIEPLFDKLIDEMKMNNKQSFGNAKINVNIFSGYDTEELAEVFGKINKYNSSLSEQEALASRLFNITDFAIDLRNIEFEIKSNIKKYYDDRNNEILKCYVYNENEPMNFYDFMIGFQNYSNTKCIMINETDSDGLSLFFKIFKTMYRGSFEVTSTTENINDFVNYIMKAINILQILKSKIFMENLVEGKSNKKVFDAASKKTNSLKKNNMYIIIIAIIGYLKNNKNEDEILKSIEKCILYHFFVNSLKNKDMKESYQIYNNIFYTTGGSLIDNKAKDYLKTPELISSKITENIMQELLKNLINESIKNKEYEMRENGKDKYDKRRPRKLHENILVYYYYVCKIPTQFLKNNFWIEHMFPFSSSWDNEIDIDRFGNIFLIIEELNKDRSNKHINEYTKIDKKHFLNYIDLVPNTELYDKIICHENKKPHIFDNEKYNAFCSENEEKMINYFLEKLFR